MTENSEYNIKSGFAMFSLPNRLHENHFRQVMLYTFIVHFHIDLNIKRKECGKFLKLLGQI